jgi:hypothetical protein
MQTIWGPGNASNILLTAQKRLLRPVYAQTQGFPYACSLDPSLRTAAGAINIPGGVFTFNGSIVPGTVLIKTTGEQVTVASGAANEVPFGLLGTWIGGTFDNIGQLNQVQAWMGPDSVYELLAPAWNDTTVSAAVASAAAGQPVKLYVGSDGRLTSTASTSGAVVATVMDRPSSARLLIKLAI